MVEDEEGGRQAHRWIIALMCDSNELNRRLFRQYQLPIPEEMRLCRTRIIFRSSCRRVS